MWPDLCINNQFVTLSPGLQRVQHLAGIGRSLNASFAFNAANDNCFQIINVIFSKAFEFVKPLYPLFPSLVEPSVEIVTLRGECRTLQPPAGTAHWFYWQTITCSSDRARSSSVDGQRWRLRSRFLGKTRGTRGHAVRLTVALFRQSFTPLVVSSFFHFCLCACVCARLGFSPSSSYQ